MRLAVSIFCKAFKHFKVSVSQFRESKCLGLAKKNARLAVSHLSFATPWIATYNEELLSKDESDCNRHPLLSNSNEENVDSSQLNDEDQWSEDEAEIPAGVSDTLLTPPDFLENNERQHVLNVAPAEGSRPLSLFRDKCCEELAYPGIFLGQNKQDNKDRIVKVHYSDICKSELRRSDRRAAMNVENIFYKTKKLQMKIFC